MKKTSNKNLDFNFKYLLSVALIAVVAVLIIGGYFVRVDESIDELDFNLFNFQRGKVAGIMIEKTATLSIDQGEGEVESFELMLNEEDTALDLLLRVGLKNNLLVETTKYDFGTMIETIDGGKNGEGGKYWMYYVNGEMPNVSADQKEVQPGDKVEFRFESM